MTGQIAVVATGQKEARYLDVAETAKCLRIGLKKHFPGIKFSVRSKSYAGGASISVSWVDGPTTKQVDRIAGNYSGANFDGMIDLKNYHTSWLLPDGSAMVADDHGTVGSRGVLPEVHNAKPEFMAERVRFGADFIFCNREIGFELAKEAAREVAFRYGFELCPVREGCRGYTLHWEDKRSAQFLGKDWSDFWEYKNIWRRWLEGERE